VVRSPDLRASSDEETEGCDGGDDDRYREVLRREFEYREAAPELISLPAIGRDHAATLMLTVGDNPERLGSEASFVSLCGVCPVEASSGKVVRQRLNLM
jgi:transposase